MFSPTKLPCTAWYVTGTLNVRECKVTGRYNGTHPTWFLTSSGQKGAGNLFPSHAAAIAEAERQLDEKRARLVKAARLVARAAATVAKLKSGGV